MRHGVGTTTGLDQSRKVSEAAAEKEDRAEGEDPKPLGFQSHGTELAPPPADALRGAVRG